MKKILVINGPNLNLLGRREPAIYGVKTLDAINEDLKRLSLDLNLSLDFFQSNHEGALIDKIQLLEGSYDGAILNAGGFTHSSVALRDAVLAAGVPIVEVHLSNPLAREHYRHRSYLTGAAIGCIAGFGDKSYELALYWFSRN
ncbi:MAG: type II 3-dehydroquinate dehydratase [Deltaproteobacteria bacterium]|nr:type II 3-dehydroquinate dehydratase [Deltaproteobacteria bacterium]